MCVWHPKTILRRALAGGFLAIAAAAFVGVAHGQDLIDQARTLLRQGKAAEALELLEPAADRLNDAESSYLLGIAALDSGQAGLAVISFERALAYNPNFTPARAELARALAATGDTDQARLELAALANADVPPEVRTKLRQLELYLAEIADKARSRTSGISGYLEAEAGYDSNVNTGINNRSVGIPLFGGAVATLHPVFEKHASAFAGLAGGFLAQKEVQPGLRLFAGADLRGRYAFKKLEDENYHTVTASGNAGVQWQQGAHTATAAFTALQNRIADVTFDKAWGVYGQWQTQLDPSNDLGAFVQWLDLQHPIQHSLDTQLTLVGVAWRRALGGSATPLLSLAAYYGNDEEQGTDPAVGRDIIGGRIGFSRQLNIGARLVTSLTYQQSRYGGTNLFFFETREDKRTDLSLGLTFPFGKDFTITPQYLYTRNKSNIPVVDFERHQLFVTARRDFR